MDALPNPFSVDLTETKYNQNTIRILLKKL